MFSKLFKSDEPLCKFYDKCYLESTKPETKDDLEQDPNLSLGRLDSESNSITAGGVGIGFMRCVDQQVFDCRLADTFVEYSVYLVYIILSFSIHQAAQC